MAHLFLIAGHGAGDSGAVGNGYQEAERVRALAGRIKALGGDNVTVADTSRNWYADKGINTLDIPTDWEILELHMDSGMASAKGAHVIIKAGYTPDAYDNALASFLSSILPGRANAIVGRSDLANPNRAAARGFSYRLAEFGFISNAGDVAIFNSRMDEIAQGVLHSFAIPSSGTEDKPQMINATIQSNTGADCMRLTLEEVSDSVYKIRDKANGFYLTASAGTADANVDFRGFDCGDYQLWKLLKKEYKNATYMMLESVAAPGLYLSVEKNGDESNNLKLYTDLHNQKQKFYIREETDGTTLLIHSYTGKCVAAKE
ncbi:MAG: RICIN domain-containing protein [Agathobacter sp.]